jgi:hypothetical protein
MLLLFAAMVLPEPDGVRMSVDMRAAVLLGEDSAADASARDTRFTADSLLSG